MADLLLLGAGLVARPLVDYLLQHGVSLTIASPFCERAEELLGDHPLGRVVRWSAEDRPTLEWLLGTHQLAVSLLPAPLHPLVAEACISARRHLVTTSYVSAAMQDLDAQARQADVLLLNELGVDPGIDHMSAMRIIHQVQQADGQISSFRSYCGGLPSPEANDNPWGYKFSWSPLAVLHAGTNGACYRKNGRTIKLCPAELFRNLHRVRLEPIGELECYPNRDALGYQALYGLPQVTTLFRGTLRWPGWSQTMIVLGELGLLDQQPRGDGAQLTWARLLAGQVGAAGSSQLRQRVASFLWLSPGDPLLERLEWLGLFDDQPLPLAEGALIEQLASQMQTKMVYAPGEQDMVLLHHEFVADYPDAKERITSTLIDYGQLGGDSSMARTVSLPAAIAARLILAGAISERGVRIPVSPGIYTPVMDELAVLGIAMQEQTFPF